MEDPSQRLLKAATAFYLVVPAFFFAWGWLRLPFAVVVLSLLGIFGGYAFRELILHLRKMDWRARIKASLGSGRNVLLGLGSVAGLILLWLAFSGIGGTGYQNTDYWANNALLKALINQDWPLISNIDGEPTPIVYYLGYYLPAAATGKSLTWLGANIFLFLWTTVGVALSFLWFMKVSRIGIAKKPSRLIFAAVLFFLAGGLDHIGSYILKGNVFEVGKHLEVWAIFFQYSSNTTLIFWVPQHAIAAWLITGMAVDSLQVEQDLEYLWIALSSSILWSPFGVLGSLPFIMLLLALYLSKAKRHHLFKRVPLAFALASLLVGGTHALFLAANQFDVPIGFYLAMVENKLRLAKHLVAFWFIEFAFLGLLVLLYLALGRNLYRRASRETNSILARWTFFLERYFDIHPLQFSLFLIALAVLTILPLFRVGVNNDLVMRSSIPSLFVFWTFILKFLLDGSLRVKIRLHLLHSLILMVILVGFLTGLSEIARSIERYQFGPPAYSEVLEIEELSERDISQRTGSDQALFFRTIGKEIELGGP
jgi:hypothetical protein